MTYPLPAAQEALYSLLSGDAVLAGLCEGVFDHVPAGAALPYVVIAGMQVADASQSIVSQDQQVSATLEIYSAHAGLRESEVIAQRLAVLLHRQPLSVSGFTMVSAQLQESEAVMLADGMTRRCRMLLQWRLRA
jgi:hypothetical protein